MFVKPGQNSTNRSIKKKPYFQDHVTFFFLLLHTSGGTIIGKTRCEDLCYSGSSFTGAGGPVLNPHDTTRSSGGSSSGSAAAVGPFKNINISL